MLYIYVNCVWMLISILWICVLATNHRTNMVHTLGFRVFNATGPTGGSGRTGLSKKKIQLISVKIFKSNFDFSKKNIVENRLKILAEFLKTNFRTIFFYI